MSTLVLQLVLDSGKNMAELLHSSWSSLGSSNRDLLLRSYINCAVYVHFFVQRWNTQKKKVSNRAVGCLQEWGRVFGVTNKQIQSKTSVNVCGMPVCGAFASSVNSAVLDLEVRKKLFVLLITKSVHEVSSTLIQVDLLGLLEGEVGPSKSDQQEVECMQVEDEDKEPEAAVIVLSVQLESKGRFSHVGHTF